VSHKKKSNMSSFYFEQLLQNGLNGMDRQGITAAVLQIAGAVLILSLLWSVYEAYANGGDVRLLGVAAIKYLILGLIFLNYQTAFRAVNGMFNGVADGIYNLSGGFDVIKNWNNSLAQAWQNDPNWFSAIWSWVTGGVSAVAAGLITLAGYLILPFTYALFTLFYALYGAILYVVGPIGKDLLRELDDLPLLGSAVCHPASANVGPADHRPHAI
jgi:hypothetical protein